MTYRYWLFAILTAGALSPAAAQTVFVSNEKDDTVSVIDAKALAVVNTFDVGKRPRGITLNKDFSKLYICASDDNRIDHPLDGHEVRAIAASVPTRG